jgi:predicted phosphodiesterase
MIEAVRQEAPDFVFFLGDGEGDLNLLRKEFPTLPVEAVRGNCDIYSSLPAELVCRVGSCLFFLTHGHRFGVKYERNFRA